MSSFQIHEIQMALLLQSQNGPVGREIDLLGQQVAAIARQKASGEVVQIRTGRLWSGIRSEFTIMDGEATSVVFTDAKDTGPNGEANYPYPYFLDIGTARIPSKPWLTSALQEARVG